MGDAIKIYHDRFSSICPPSVNLVKLHGGMQWAEGPVYFPLGDYLLWSDIPNNRIWQWIEGFGARVYREPSNFANGNTRDLQGRLITCEHLSRRVTRTEADNSIVVLADSYRGKRLNSPNDVVVKSDGSIWFTDPPYGILSDYEGRKSPAELDASYVFRLDSDSLELEIVASSLEKPNGLAFSPDESILYVSDTGATHNKKCPRRIHAFDVSDSNQLENQRSFTDIPAGVADGFRIDLEGNLWTSSGSGVLCYSAEADLLGEIPIDETVSNLEFGGPDFNCLFITATSSLYSIRLGISGVRKYVFEPAS